ncbi:hypothetical protein [Gymnodinialimonas hymeniacidonis]|uniref:hypothetical protein n=1 Tax=Gymnodinialimonas hymeniacidonis TaxID=3126508 RepID=UPI0034C5B62F
MANRHPAILIVTVAIVAVLSYLIVAQITYPWRGAAAGFLLGAFAGVLVWFAKTRRHAVARGIISVGATAIAAPAAGLAAAQNDFLFNIITDDGDLNDAAFDGYEAAMATGLTLLWMGAIAALVLFITGWRLHRR